MSPVPLSSVSNARRSARAERSIILLPSFQYVKERADALLVGKHLDNLISQESLS